METVNAADYFANLQAQRANELLDTGAWNRQTDLITQKQQELNLRNEERINALRQAREAKLRNEQESLAGKLGLAEGDFGHTPVNLAASLFSASTRAVGNIATAGLDLYSMAQESDVPEEVLQAFTRHQQGVATPDDMVLLGQNSNSQLPEEVRNNLARMEQDGFYQAPQPSYLDRLTSAAKSREVSGIIADAADYSSIVDDTNRRELSSDLAAGGEEGLARLKKGLENIQDDHIVDGVADFVSGAAELLVNAGDAVMDNPTAMAEYIAEMGPELAIGAVSKTLMTVRNVGYGVDNYRKGIEKYQAEHNGELPDLETRNRMALHAFAASAAETLGDLTILGAGGKAASKTPSIGKRALRSADESIGGALTEAATEGFQTYAEGEASLTPVTAEEIYEGAVIGGAAGGAISTGLSVTRETAEALGNRETEKRKKRLDAAATDAAFNQAVDTGDITALTDTGSPQTYHPGRAAAALAQRIQSESTTEEEKADSRKQLDTLYGTMDSKIAAQEQALAQTTEEAVSKQLDELDQYKRQLEDTPASEQETIADLQALVSELEAGIQSNTDEKRIQQLEGSLQKNKEHHRIISEALENISAVTRPADEDINALIEQTQAVESTPERQVAADKVITLLMESPDSLAGTDINQLASSGGFSAAQQAYLKATAAAQEKQSSLRSLEDVNTEILYGSDQNKGIRDYARDMAHAVRTGNGTRAAELLGGITRFYEGHQAKAAVMRQALEQVQQTGQPVYVVKEQGAYSITTDKPTGKAAPRSFLVHRNSGNAIQAIEQEAEVLRTAVEQLRAQAGLIKTATQEPAVNEATQEAPVEENPTEEAPLEEEVDRPEAAIEQPVTLTSTEEAEVSVEEEAVRLEAALAAEKTPDEDGAGILEEGLGVSGTLSTEEFGKTNLLHAYFEQGAGKDTDTTLRPLTQVKNFLSAWIKDKQLVRQFVETKAKGDEPVFTKEQGRLFSVFARNAVKWNQHILDSLNNKVNPLYRHRDYLQFFRNDRTPDGQPKALEDGQSVLDENVLTAISFAAFSWLVENAGGAGIHNDKGINALLGRKKDTYVDPQEREALAEVGDREKLVMQAMGKYVAEALGLKARRDAPANSQAQLEGHLGAHALGLLLDFGFVERTKVDGSFFAHKDGPENDVQDIEDPEVDSAPKWKEPHPFIRVTRDFNQAGNPVNPEVLALFEAHKGTAGVLSSLFGVQAGQVLPEESPSSFTQEKTKKTLQEIPNTLKRILNRTKKRKHFTRVDMQKARSVMDREFLDEISGVVDLENRYTHTTRRKGLEAKNNSLRLELDALEDFETNRDPAEPFYFTPSVQRHQRVGLTQNAVNPQSKKAQRHNIAMEAWKTEVDPQKESTTRTNFLLAVAQAMGIDTDKQNTETSLNELNLLMLRKEISDAIEILQRIPEMGEGERLSPEEQRVIADAAKVGKGKFHSLDGLVSWAEYQKGKPFTASIMYEVDGVSNGPTLAHISLGAIHFGEAFGFFTEGSKEQSYPEWKMDPGHLDIYETLVSSMARTLRLEARHDVNVQKQVQGIEFFTGTLSLEDGSATKDGRKLLKQPFTAIIFGSSVSTAVDDMAAAFVDSIYERMEEAANSADPAAALQLTLETVNTLLGTQLVDAKMSLDEAMEFTFTPGQRKVLEKRFSDTVGREVGNTLDKTLSGFMSTRKELNKAAQLSWVLYDIAYRYKREQLIADKRKKGELPERKNNAGPAQDITQQEEDAIREELKALAPLVHTPLSKQENNRDAGILMAKPSFSIATRENAPYTGEVKSSSDRATLEPRGKIREETDPGVSPVILLVHSLESAIAALTYKAVDALHIHDAEGFGITDMQAGAAHLNRNTFQLLSTYSLPMEISDTFRQSMREFKRMLKANPGMADELHRVGKVLYGSNFKESLPALTAIDALDDFMSTVSKTALVTEATKLNYLLSTKSVNQYALQDGSYEITQNDKALLQERLDGLEGIRKAQVADDLKQAKDLAAVLAKPKAGETAWGQLGEPLTDSDPVLVEALSGGKPVPAKTVLRTLYRQIQATMPEGRLKQFNLALLSQIGKTVSPDVRIQMVTANSPAVSGIEDVDRAKGLYSLSEDGETIYVKSPEFVHSGITPELLLHEMTHAVLAQLIEGELAKRKKNPKYASEVLEAIDELEALRKAAADFNEANKLNFGKAVQNVHELVAWGMTNAAFQKQVLNKIQMESDAAQRTKESGMRGFIRNLVKILFRGSSKSSREIAENGMSILIANTSLLFEAADAGKEKTNSETLVLKSEDPDPLLYTTDQVYQGLGNTDGNRVSDPVFDRHLREVLASVVETVYGPNEVIKPLVEQQAALSAEDTFLNAMATGQAPFASQALARLKLNNQEAFVLESVEVTLREAMSVSVKAREELRKLFKEAKARLNPSDFHSGNWSHASATEKAHAEETYNFLFRLQQNEDGTSDYLSRFAAVGLAYKPLYDRLAEIQGRTDTRTYSGLSLAAKLKLALDRALQALAYYLTGTHAGQRGHDRLMSLAKNLAGVEARRKATLIRRQDRTATVLERGLRSASEEVRGAVEKFGRSAIFRNSKSGIIRAAGSVTSAVAGDRVDLIWDAIERTRNGRFKERLGLVGSLINEVRGATDSTMDFHALLQAANKHEQDRKHIKDETAAMVRNSFGRKLQERELKAVTQAVLRTDLAALLGRFTLAEMEGLLADPQRLENAIQTLERQVAGAYRGFYLDSARALGHFMATGETSREHLLMNAHNIVNLMGTGTSPEFSGEQLVDLKNTIDSLASLYALKYTSFDQRSAVKEVLREELAREEGNGIEMVMLLHKKLQEDALNTLFDGSPVNMIKGYTKDIFNPYVEVVAANTLEGSLLEQAGYSKGAMVGRDPADPDNSSRHLYVIKDGGLPSYVTGIVSNTGKRTRGTTLHSGLTDEVTGEINQRNQRELDRFRASKQAAIRSLLNSRGNFDPSRSTGTRMVPVFNPNGAVVNYRYMMENTTKDNLLERNNLLDQVLGTMAASAFDKVESEANNAMAVDALFAQYRAEYGSRPEAYLEFSESSTDPAIREAYRLLPAETKRHIRRVWGRNAMMIRNDLFDMTFGYRKYSLSDMFKRSSKLRQYNRGERYLPSSVLNQIQLNAVEKILTGILDPLLGPKAALRVRQAEDIWQALVKEVKDIWVIKNLFTLIGNITSNLTELLWFGVPVQDIVKHHITALVGILTYQRDRRELHKLQSILDIGYVQGNTLEIQERIAELEDAISRNPVKELVDAGLFQTIVEDIDSSEDNYSYKARLVRKVDEHTQWVPKGLKTVAKTLYMAHDTPLYRVMNQATHLSDFVARYTLHQHMTTRKDNPMASRESLQLAVEAFVNYDIPTHRSVQYLNDTGLIWFTKYYLRIQKVLMHLYKENPGRALGVLALGQFIPSLGNIMDSGFWGRIGNPFDWGALNYPGALDEIITIRAAMSPFN